MKKNETRFSFITKVWIVFFLVWGAILSGVASGFFGSPGVIQAFRLHGLLETKKTQMSQLESDLEKLDADRVRFEKSATAQEREVRRVLGYAAADEMIFDFTPTERLGI